MAERPWLKFYDPGVPQSIDYPQKPLYHFLEESARNYPHQPCTIFKGAEITYAEMDALTDQLAAGLAELGVKKGTPVGLFMANIPQFVISFFGILKAGGVVVAFNPLYKSREIEHQLNDSGLEIIITMSLFYNTLKEVQPKTSLKTIAVTNIKEALPGLLRFLFTLTQEKKGGHRVELAEGDVWFQDLISNYKPENRPVVDIGPDDKAIFQYSGGTTGISKAAVALHRNLVANTLQIRSFMPDIEMGKEIILMAIPLFHVYGLVAGMSFGVSSGA
ncbi:MAG: hypothetical protein AMJ88_15595, partial [Anaerolineae bacterium SM23_ 63]